MSARGAGAIIAGLVFVVGVIIGFVPHSITGDSVFPTIACGAPFNPSDDAKSTDLGAGLAGVSRDYESKCSDALGAPRAIALSLIGVGVLALLFCGLTWNSNAPVERKVEDDPVSS